DAVHGMQLANRSGLLGAWIFNILRFVEANRIPRQGTQLLLVQLGQGVSSEHYVRLCNRRGKKRSFRTVGTVMQMHLQAGGKSPKLLLPIAEHRGRANEQRRRLVMLMLLDIQQIGDPLHRFAKSHIVGETASESEPAQQEEP